MLRRDEVHGNRTLIAATVLQAIAEHHHVDTGDIDDIIWSISSQRGTKGGDQILAWGNDLEGTAMNPVTFAP